MHIEDNLPNRGEDKVNLKITEQQSDEAFLETQGRRFPQARLSVINITYN